MRNLILTVALLIGITVVMNAQSGASSQKIKESEVPKAVKDAHDNTIGFLAEQWVKLTINNAPRYVAVVQQMDQSSGKTLTNRYRYSDQGKSTSTSQYRGNGKGEEKNFYSVYLGTGDVDPAFENKIGKLIQENTLISFEGFSFTPGNQTTTISTHRLVLNDKKGKKVILYFDREGKEVDITKYPLRKLEAEEID